MVRWQHRGQAITEYPVLLAVVALVILGLQFYAKRGLQAGIKQAADRLSPYTEESGGDPDGEKAQRDGMRYESGERRHTFTRLGDVLQQQTASRTVVAPGDHVVITTEQPGGERLTVILQDTTTTTGEAMGKGYYSYSKVITEDQQ